jgi:hypothetical protein
MLPVSYVRDFIVWAWRCGRGWIELGHRVQALEAEVGEQARKRQAADDELRATVEGSAASFRDSREGLQHRIDEMDRAQRRRIDAMDAAQQERIDAWAQQLSSQINQVLLALASRAPSGGSEGE